MNLWKITMTRKILLNLILILLIQINNPMVANAKEYEIFGDSQSSILSNTNTGKMSGSKIGNKSLEDKIKKVNYIDDLMVVMTKQPESDLNKYPITVTILLKLSQSNKFNKKHIEQIKKILLKSEPKLKSENISISSTDGKSILEKNIIGKQFNF